MSARMYTCGVPAIHCCGASVKTSFGVRVIESTRKAHNSPTEAFKCRARWLVKVEGYTRIGSREFSPPDGGPVLVLTKKIRFGGALRKGKGGEYGAGRVMPDKHPGGLIASY